MSTRLRVYIIVLLLACVAGTISARKFSTPPVFVPATWYVRSDGASSPTCNGHTDASAASTPNCAYASIQDASNAALRGDTINIQQGVNFNVTTPITFATKPGSFNGTNYITVQSTAVASLPASGTRVGISDAANMPTITVTQRGTAAISITGTGYKFVGLQVTNNLSGNTSADITNVMIAVDSDETVFERMVMHPKEHPTLGTAWLTRGKFAFNIAGVSPANNTTVRDSYIYDFFGRDPNDSQFTNGSGQQTECWGVGSNVNGLTIQNNYCQAWYATMQTAGSDGQAFGANSSTVSNATMSSFDLASTTGLSAGMIISVYLPYSSDPNNCPVPLQPTVPCPAMARVNSVVAGHVTLVNNLVVKNQSGIRVPAYTLPVNGATAVWNGQQPTNITMRWNTLEIPLDFSVYHQSTNGNTGKGVIEGKACLTCTFEGNIIQGFPSSFALTTTNQNGAAPWQTTANVIVRNNWFKAYRTGVLLSLTDYGAVCTQGHDITVTNNLFVRGVSSGDFIRVSGPTSNVTITHNTVVRFSGTEATVELTGAGASQGGCASCTGSQLYYPVSDGATGVTIKDNLLPSGYYTAICYLSTGGGTGSAYLGCYTSPVQDHNTFYFDFSGADPLFVFPGATNATIANMASIPFVGSDENTLADWAVQASSTAHNSASDGTDRGVNIATLAAGMSGNSGFTTPPSSFTVCKWNTDPACQ